MVRHKAKARQRDDLRWRCKRELQGIMRALLGGEKRYTASRQRNLADAGALLRQMRVGQQPKDFRAGEVWGYAKHKFARRAQQVCEAFGCGAARHPCIRAALSGATARVVSVGGGPGNDLVGYWLYEQLQRGGASTAPSASTLGSADASADASAGASGDASASDDCRLGP